MPPQSMFCGTWIPKVRLNLRLIWHNHQLSVIKEQKFPLPTTKVLVRSQHPDGHHLSDSQRKREAYYVSYRCTPFSDKRGHVTVKLLLQAHNEGIILGSNHREGQRFSLAQIDVSSIAKSLVELSRNALTKLSESFSLSFNLLSNVVFLHLLSIPFSFIFVPYIIRGRSSLLLRERI